MTPRDRREARIALAMLPLGVLLTVAAVVAIAVFAAGVVFLMIAQVDGWAVALAWAAMSLILSVKIMLWGIETMSSFEPRPALFALGATAAIAAGCPYWYLA